MFCIQPLIVEFSGPIVFGENRLRERGSLPATFYVLPSVFYMANDNTRKFKQNQIIICIQPWFVESSRCVIFGKDRLRERGSLPAIFYVLKGYFLWQTIRAANSNRIKYVSAYSPVLLSTKAVSYTHLDVYKRQVL